MQQYDVYYCVLYTYRVGLELGHIKSMKTPSLHIILVFEYNTYFEVTSFKRVHYNRTNKLITIRLGVHLSDFTLKKKITIIIMNRARISMQ